MGATLKNEHKTDGWHIGCRLRRKARPAGRLNRLVADEMAALLDEAQLIVFEPNTEDEPDLYWDTECGCACRRCRLHGDCGGCLTGHKEGR